MHNPCIALKYNETKVSYLLRFFNKTRALGFQYFELRNILKFQYSVVSSFIDSGAGLLLSIWFVLALELNSKNIL